MENTLKELNAAYQRISSLQVSGDAVDVVAEARCSLRKVYADIKKLQAEAKAAEDETQSGDTENT